MTEIIIQDEMVQTTALSVLPTMNENAVGAINRSLAVYRAINTLVDMTFNRGVDFDDVTGKKEGDKDYKPTLLLPGIEKVMGLLGLTETFKDIHVERIFEPNAPFFYYEVECVLVSVVTGQVVARGQGVCHTREKAFMKIASRTCPLCGKATINRSKDAPKNSPAGTEPGWYCWRKIDGCGAEFPAKDERITSQQVGNIPDTQLVWDGVNRARKIANKRAKAEAVKRIGMLSSRFTVDLEDDMRYSDADLIQKPVSAGVVVTEEATVTAVEQPPPHWSKVASQMKVFIETARKAGYIENAQGEADLLKLVGKPDWLSYERGDIAKDALTAAVKALRVQPTPSELETPKSNGSPFGAGVVIPMNDKEAAELKRLAAHDLEKELELERA